MTRRWWVETIWVVYQVQCIANKENRRIWESRRKIIIECPTFSPQWNIISNPPSVLTWLHSPNHTHFILYPMLISTASPSASDAINHTPILRSVNPRLHHGWPLQQLMSEYLHHILKLQPILGTQQKLGDKVRGTSRERDSPWEGFGQWWVGIVEVKISVFWRGCLPLTCYSSFSSTCWPQHTSLCFIHQCQSTM